MSLNGNAAAARIARAQMLYPAAFRRVLAACRHVARDVDVEDHVARIVLAAYGGRI